MPSISESLGMLGFARWQAVVDFVGLVVAFYVLLRWSRAARALRITLAIVGLHALALAAYHWGLLITSWLIDGLVGLAVLLVLVVFQPELRRLFMDLDRVVRRFPHPWAVSLSIMPRSRTRASRWRPPAWGRSWSSSGGMPSANSWRAASVWAPTFRPRS